MPRDTIPDALADALGLIVADHRKMWRLEMETAKAEARAQVAELREQVVTLTARLTEMAAAQIARVDTAIASIVNGKDADPAEMERMITEQVSRAFDAVPKPKDGTSVTVEDLAPSVAEAIAQALPDMVAGSVEAAVKALPTPKDGESVDPAEVRAMVDEAVAEAVKALPPPEAGRDADPAETQRMVDEAVENAVGLAVTKAIGDIELPRGEPGKDADMDALKSFIHDQVKAAVAEIPPPADGKDVDMDVVKATIIDVAKAIIADNFHQPADGESVDMEEVKAILAEEVQRAAAAIPVPAGVDMDQVKAHLTEEVKRWMPEPVHGKSVTVEDVAPLLESMVKDAVDAIPVPKDGADADMAAISAQVEKQVAETLEAWPRPKDGESVTVAMIEPVIAERIEAAVKALPVPKDGIGMAGALIDRDGNLVITLSNGEAKPLGHVVGRDADMNALVEAIKSEVAKIPAPKDGVDGVGFEDMELSFDGEKTLLFTFTRGDLVKEFALKTQMPVYRGFWEESRAYEPGDVVSFGGTSYVAKTANTGARVEDQKAWGIMAKRGKTPELPAEKKAAKPAPRPSLK